MNYVECESWIIKVPIKCTIENELFEIACREIAAHNICLIGYALPSGKYESPEITIQINDDMSIYDAYEYASAKRDAAIDYAFSFKDKRLAKDIRNMVIARSPVYSRAIKK